MQLPPTRRKYIQSIVSGAVFGRPVVRFHSKQRPNLPLLVISEKKSLKLVSQFPLPCFPGVIEEIYEALQRGHELVFTISVFHEREHKKSVNVKPTTEKERQRLDRIVNYYVLN